MSNGDDNDIYTGEPATLKIKVNWYNIFTSFMILAVAGVVIYLLVYNTVGSVLLSCIVQFIIQTYIARATKKWFPPFRLVSSIRA